MKYINKIKFLVLLMLGVQLFGSCSKQENELVLMDLEAKGVSNELNNINQLLGKPSSVSFDNGSGQIYSAETPIKGLGIADGTTPLLKANENEKVKIRIFLYTAQDNKFFKSVQLPIDYSGTIDVPAGETYNWFAYSYNTVQDIPEPVNRNNPTIETPVDKNLYYGSGLETATALGLNVTIKLKSIMSRAVIVFNARPVFAKRISSLTAKFLSPLKKGTLDIKTGIVSNFTAAVGTPIVLSNADDFPADDVMRSQYFYTADPVSLKNFEISITDWKVELIKNKILTLISKSKEYKFSGFSGLPGQTFTGNVDAVEQGVIVDGVEWAKGNLYLENARYAFRDNTYTTYPYQSDYWYWGAMRPNDQPPSGSSRLKSYLFQDPCRLVLPLGAWRMPTRAEYRPLESKFKDRNTHPATGTIGAKTYVEFQSTSGPSGVLRFNLDGEMEKSGKVDNRNDGLYWTSERKSNTNAYSMEADQTWFKSDQDWEINEKRYNIRCVRNFW